MKKGQKAGIVILGILAGVFVLSYFVVPFFTKDTYSSAVSFEEQSASSSTVVVAPKVLHIDTPESVKGIYMTSCVVGSKNLREGLVKIADDTEINSIIIDVKDFSGTLSFVPKNPDLLPYVSKNCLANDMEDFLKYLHEKNIYAIARVTVFQDPFYVKLHPESAVRKKSDGGVWKDKKGISYIDPGSIQAWDYTIEVAKAAYDIGFDEINFDYIRYPSDGNISDISLPTSGGESKQAVLESFFSYLYNHLSALNIKTSADLFGMTTTNYDDLGIGQVLERALPYFDFIDPMVYPSHYPPNFNGWKDPNKHPYDLVYYTMKRSVERTLASTSPIATFGSTRIGTSTPPVFVKIPWSKNKMRPWIQDFNYGGTYGVPEVSGQIQATYDAGLNSWLVWSPSNRYTSGAFKPAE